MSPASPALQLPPPFSVVSLREAGDAFARAQEIAADEGAATLVWTRRFDLAEFAVVLEPEEPLRLARRVVYAGMNALGDTLASLAPPERPVTFDWPDAVQVDGALVGGVRLAWPAQAPEEEVPDWLVFGVMIRTVVMRAGDPGLRPLFGGLDEQGFEEVSPSAVIESWTRYFLREMDRCNETGFDGARTRWRRRALHDFAIADDGSVTRDGARHALDTALAEARWLDPETGAPRL